MCAQRTVHDVCAAEKKTVTRTTLPTVCQWLRELEVSIVSYTRAFDLLINVQNISLYTCKRRHAMTDTSKTAKIIKRWYHSLSHCLVSALPCRVLDSHNGVQGIKQFGASIPGRRLQLGQRRHSPTTFSRLPDLYCTEDKDTARWLIIRRRRPTSLEQFARAGCTANRRRLRTVQSATKDTFVWLIETVAPSDFCF